MVILRVKSGTEKGKVYELANDTIGLGRDRDGAVQILDQGVSRKHAEIFRVGELFFIRDLQSRNGTFVNEEKVSEVVLRLGDQIQIGNTTLIFEDRLARLRDSQEILTDEGNGPAQDAPFEPSSTLHIPIGDTVTGKMGIPARAEESPESRRLNALVAISQIIGSEHNLSMILNQAAQKLGVAVDADNVFIFHIRDASSSASAGGGGGDNGKGSAPSRSFELLGRYDRSEETHGESVSRSIIRDCLEKGRAVLTSDAGLDARFHAMASVVMKRIRSVICVPITGLGKVIGVLYISNSQKTEAFHGEDLELASAAACQLGTTIQLLQIVQRSDSFFRDSIRTLVAAIEMRDPANEGRAERMARICLAIAKELGWSTHECRNAWLAGMLYDIGSIPLSDRDREAQFTLDTRKNHYATVLLENMPGIAEILPGITQQKERWDGSGGPEGLKGDQICKLAQILGLASEFEGLLRAAGGTPGASSEKEALLKVSKLVDAAFPRQLVNALLLAYRRGRLFKDDATFFEIPS